MSSPRPLLWTALVTATLVAAAATAHTSAGIAVFVGLPVREALAIAGAGGVLSPFTGWVTALALVMPVLVILAQARDGARWWVPSLVASGVLLAWAVVAWVDGGRVTAAWVAGDPAQAWVEWPGDATPLRWDLVSGATGWSLDLLAATGPVIVLGALWTGPLLLRAAPWALRAHLLPQLSTGAHLPTDDAVAREAVQHDGQLDGTQTTVRHQEDATVLPGSARPSVAAAQLEREVARACQVAAAVGTLLGAALVALQLAGGMSLALTPYGDGGLRLLLRPESIVVVVALAAAWRIGGLWRAPGRPSALGAVSVLVVAAVVVGLLAGTAPDMLMSVGAVLGVVCAAVRGRATERLCSLLLDHPGSGSAAAPEAGVAEPSSASETTTPPQAGLVL